MTIPPHIITIISLEPPLRALQCMGVNTELFEDTDKTVNKEDMIDTKREILGNSLQEITLDSNRETAITILKI